MSDLLLADFPVVIELSVLWGEMDALGHVNNIIYFRYFEQARIAYFQRLGLELGQGGQGLGPILASTEARFRKPLKYPDRIRIGARVTDILEDRFMMEYRIVSERLGAVAAEGKGLIVTYDYGAGKKVPIPAEVRQRLTDLEAQPRSDAR
jgi:acyl-CoA thioester hydrolase